MLDRVAGIVVQLALVPILAAHWGLERYGLWGMLIALPGILLLSDLGFATAATVRMTMQIAKGQREAARVTMHSASQVVLAAAGVILALGSSVAVLLPDRAFHALSAIAPGEVRGAILCLTGYSALIVAQGLLQAVFRSNHRFAVGSLLSTATLLLENALLVGMVLMGEGVLTGAAALLAGRIAGLAIAAITAARLPGGVLPGLHMADPAVRRELLGPALAAMAIPLGLTLMVQGQVVVLGIAAGAAAVPAFVAARTLSRLGLQIAQALSNPLMPEFATVVARGNHAGTVRYFVIVLAGAMVLALGSAVLLAVAGPWIVSVWSGGHIVAAPQMMLIIVVSALAGGIWNPVSNLMLAINEHARFAPALLGLSVAGLLFTVAAGKTLGSDAAAVSMAAIDLTMLVIVTRFALAHWGKPGEWGGVLAAMARQTGDELRRLARG